ncbi:MAG: hypothetical protein L0212_04020 [Acidobacteria bacterium]|nr:hypothetical protein [Acidobacteriota bacterium]
MKLRIEIERTKVNRHGYLENAVAVRVFEHYSSRLLAEYSYVPCAPGLALGETAVTLILDDAEIAP